MKARGPLDNIAACGYIEHMNEQSAVTIALIVFVLAVVVAAAVVLGPALGHFHLVLPTGSIR
jgi:hypothetical protein